MWMSWERPFPSTNHDSLFTVSNWTMVMEEFHILCVSSSAARKVFYLLKCFCQSCFYQLVWWHRFQNRAPDDVRWQQIGTSQSGWTDQGIWDPRTRGTHRRMAPLKVAQIAQLFHDIQNLFRVDLVSFFIRDHTTNTHTETQWNENTWKSNIIGCFWN